jgi:iron uptake system component EfeO
LILLGLTMAVTAGCAGSGSGPAVEPRQVSGRGDVMAVTVTAADGCVPDRTTLVAGPLTVRIKNRDATAVSEIELRHGDWIVGEKENVPPGFRGQFTVSVKAGKYALYCPGANPEWRTITVTGRATGTRDDALAGLLGDATRNYAEYVTNQVRALLTATQRLARALHGTSLAAAQRAYIAARPYYEKIEPVAESFVVGTDSIDADIDARAGDVPAAGWRGFHRIEQALFQNETLAGVASYGAQLVADTRRLLGLTAGLRYQPTQLANGAQELLDEVAASKITGEEERYSRIDVLDIAYNVEGSQQAFAQLEPALERIDPDLLGTISRAFSALDTLVDNYRTDSNPSGYLLYGELGAADKTRLAAAVKAVQEPLSRVASKVARA